MGREERRNQIHFLKAICIVCGLMSGIICALPVRAQETGDVVLIPETEEMVLTSETESPVDFESSWELNKDIYSWLEVPGTVIDYPVLQSQKDQEYYLNYNVNGEEDIYGSIFSQNCNKLDYTDFLTVLYGHNMRDGSMFGTLYTYEDPNVMWNNKYIYIYLPEATLKYEIFSAHYRGNRNLLYQFDQDDLEQRQEFLDEMEEEGLEVQSYDPELFSTLTVDSHILILSTCYKNDARYRFVVEAVLDESEGDWNKRARELGVKETETEEETEELTETEELAETGEGTETEAQN